ncbi:DUF5781 family protein [Haladaptatus sp. DFWS20]|uniref:DUF5781 family protein n=1 Tax=Haladaptatus sp. DFWS20 TaxID=3403467 RepID=UPI003EB84C26
MDIRIHGSTSPTPFLSASDLFETEHDLDRPVHVRIRDDPDERTWTSHPGEYHVLNISRQAATSAMARELALHEYSHMARNEQSHPSHTQSTAEALFLAFAGRSVERRKLTHCYQIANHMKDIYADDITLRVGPSDKLVAYLESELATAIADRPTHPRGRRMTATTDPEMTAVNAAFALALVERHDLVPRDHRLYDLARTASRDAPTVDVQGFKYRFLSLADDPGKSEYRKALVDASREYVLGGANEGQAAD